MSKALHTMRADRAQLREFKTFSAVVALPAKETVDDVSE